MSKHVTARQDASSMRPGFLLIGQAFIGTKSVVVAKDRHVIETDSALETEVVEELWVFDKGVSETRPECCSPLWSVVLGFLVDDTVK